MTAKKGTHATLSPVTVSLEDLRNGSIPISSLEEAFGPYSLGIIIVKDLPSHYPSLRRCLLSHSSYLANLPASHLNRLENPTAKYLTGWSLGKEKLKSDRPDTLKGSYYINCAFHTEAGAQGSPVHPPSGSTAAKEGKSYEGFPEYTAENVWPEEEILPGFRETSEEMCNLIIDVAALVAAACDRFAEAHLEGYDAGYLERVVRTSMATKARLLHYFPPPPATESNTDGDGEEADEDDWCATHVDHGCLTGLTSAMYIDEDAHPPTLPSDIYAPPPLLPELSKPPSPEAGLYIRSRNGTTTKVSIPKNCLGFQTGEALEVITRGRFRAVPHFVRGVRGEEGRKVARNTLAVFTQPNLWDVVDTEKGVDFAGFARGVVEKNY